MIGNTQVSSPTAFSYFILILSISHIPTTPPDNLLLFRINMVLMQTRNETSFCQYFDYLS
ncbi:hypothetical protein A0J61_04432 [Choanephora cucurbitarum]|uniref:Uncharacterized protein n=1 Tax=Choanephora cucurbitarum TaxID=101091 RepID=A0A1C7NEH6_9FUNG|nr:hypothetical protein A0J61_04432 [Choanephora cucurbitarum]